MGVAVSDSLPDSMLVICEGIPYVYRFPCHQATQEVKKYKIQGDKVKPTCIVANANTAVIKLPGDKITLVVCSLPNFTQQSQVQMSFTHDDLSISTNYLLVMGLHEMVMKSLDEGQDLCRIKPPVGWVFGSVSFRNNAREIYAACDQGDKGCVYRYKWDADKSHYVNTDCVIDGIGWVWSRRLSVTSGGLLAFNEFDRDGGRDGVKLFNLE